LNLLEITDLCGLMRFYARLCGYCKSDSAKHAKTDEKLAQTRKAC